MIRPLLLVALLLPAVLGAQESRRIPRLADGTRVRLTTQGTRYQGRLLGTEGSDLLLAQDAGTRRVPLAAVDTLWRRTSRAKRGAVIGGAIGAVATSAFFIWLVDTFCETDSATCHRDMVKVGLFGIGVGGAGGALVGAGVGALAGGWQREVP